MEESSMTNQTTTKGKYKFVFRRGRTLTKVALLGVIVLSSVALIAISNAKARSAERLENNRNQAIEEELRQNQYNDNLNNLGSSDYIGDIANSELNLDNPGSIIFVPNQGNVDNQNSAVNKDDTNPTSHALIGVIALVSITLIAAYCAILIYRKRLVSGRN
jgi:cell division protein FtsB